MRTVTTLAALAAAGSALAQDATDDWDLLVDAEHKVTMAYVDFGNVGLAVRCNDGGYEAIMTGLPPAPDQERREITLQFADDAQPYSTRWNVAVDPAIAVSERPAAFARDLMQGGRLQIVVPGGATDGRNLRYVLDLPTQHASIDRTLETCGKPLVDARDTELEALGDTGLPGGIGWAQRPRPSYPDRGNRVYTRGFAVVTCLSEPDGGLRTCEIETEHPRDGGFGEATLNATRRARLENSETPGDPVPLRKILFRADFRMESAGDAAMREGIPSRLPRNTPPSLNRGN